ncbi:MerR family transcriptional regulator [Halalkalibacter alkalisediminis]|uniref:MerR family transcriptional regulator n=1 Tax=Halalkalibacter alkalisediminis TaxID=935616 RepID=A0ABV6NMX6_9BACI|nr:MerR family transcriptional regulator [Halalkalibacter alkalisediminis]
MNTYTAKELVELLQSEEVEINLRTVRYYTQIGLLPPLPVEGNKRVYTTQHMDYIKAIISLSKTGLSLAEIQKKVSNLTFEEIKNIGKKLFLFKEEVFLKNETIKVSKDAFITVSSKVSAEKQQEVVNAVSKILLGEVEHN